VSKTARGLGRVSRELVLVQPAASIGRNSFEGVLGQYVSLGFGLACQGAGISRSMGSVGDCYDNAGKSSPAHPVPLWQWAPGPIPHTRRCVTQPAYRHDVDLAPQEVRQVRLESCLREQARSLVHLDEHVHRTLSPRRDLDRLADMRAAREYHRLDIERLWITAKQDIPKLLGQIDAIERAEQNRSESADDAWPAPTRPGKRPSGVPLVFPDVFLLPADAASPSI
jgi:hypothetical protein